MDFSLIFKLSLPYPKGGEKEVKKNKTKQNLKFKAIFLFVQLPP